MMNMPGGGMGGVRPPGGKGSGGARPPGGRGGKRPEPGKGMPGGKPQREFSWEEVVLKSRPKGIGWREVIFLSRLPGIFALKPLPGETGRDFSRQKIAGLNVGDAFPRVIHAVAEWQLRHLPHDIQKIAKLHEMVSNYARRVVVTGPGSGKLRQIWSRMRDSDKWPLWTAMGEDFQIVLCKFERKEFSIIREGGSISLKQLGRSLKDINVSLADLSKQNPNLPENQSLLMFTIWDRYLDRNQFIRDEISKLASSTKLSNSEVKTFLKKRFLLDFQYFLVAEFRREFGMVRAKKAPPLDIKTNLTMRWINDLISAFTDPEFTNLAKPLERGKQYRDALYAAIRKDQTLHTETLRLLFRQVAKRFTLEARTLHGYAINFFPLGMKLAAISAIVSDIPQYKTPQDIIPTHENLLQSTGFYSVEDIARTLNKSVKGRGLIAKVKEAADSAVRAYIAEQLYENYFIKEVARASPEAVEQYRATPIQKNKLLEIRADAEKKEAEAKDMFKGLQLVDIQRNADDRINAKLPQYLIDFYIGRTAYSVIWAINRKFDYEAKGLRDELG